MPTEQTSSKTTSVIVGLIAAAIGGAAMLLLAIVWRGVRPAGSSAQDQYVGAAIPPEALAEMVIPDFTLVDQDGRAVTKHDVFGGRMSLLAFSFTNCPTVCPIMHSHLAQVCSETLRGSPVQIVTISVDPEHDTPEALREHAERLGVTDANWAMLTGDQDVIRSIVTSMKFAVASDPSLTVTLKSGQTMPNIVHPTKLILVGPEATVIGLDSGLDYDSVVNLARRARELALRMGVK